MSGLTADEMSSVLPQWHEAISRYEDVQRRLVSLDTAQDLGRRWCLFRDWLVRKQSALAWRILELLQSSFAANTGLHHHRCTHSHGSRMVHEYGAALNGHGVCGRWAVPVQQLRPRITVPNCLPMDESMYKCLSTSSNKLLSLLYHSVSFEPLVPASALLNKSAPCLEA